MANYYLKNIDASRVYRISYSENSMPPAEGNPPVYYSVQKVFVCDTNVGPILPDGTYVSEPDQEITLSALIVDLVISNLVDATLADYRAAATGMIDGSWA